MCVLIRKTCNAIRTFQGTVHMASLGPLGEKLALVLVRSQWAAASTSGLRVSAGCYIKR
jgi:hypothetical protein